MNHEVIWYLDIWTPDTPPWYIYRVYRTLELELELELASEYLNLIMHLSFLTEEILD